MANTIIVFGSSLYGAPRDIDVLHDVALWSEREEAIVRTWAARQRYVNIDPALPLDLHFKMGGPDFTFYVPAPFYRDVPLTVLSGTPRIEFQRFFGFASAIRAYGNDSLELLRVLRERGGFRMAVAPRDVRDSDWGRWDAYTQGLTALRSAVHHYPFRDEFREGFPYTAIVERLVREDPRMSFEFQQELQKSSPFGYGELVVDFRWDGNSWIARTVYGNRTWTSDELEAELWDKALITS